MSGRVLLYCAWLIALMGLIFSLYWGEFAGIQPCTSCWYQRIALYPLTVILGIAAYREDREIVIYALPLAVVGAVLALLHTVNAPLCSDVCRPTSLSTLSLIGFSAIAALLVLVRKASIK